MSEQYKLELHGISKSFPGVKALDNVNIALRKGTVHAIMGENGAGKSTLMKIIKAVAFQAQVIIMDEPTSSISDKEVEFLFGTIRRLKKEGLSFLYISHKIDEIFQIADDITIIRDGKTITSGPVSDFTEDQIIAHMVGRSIDNIYPKESVKPGEVVFEAKGLSTDGMFENISMYVRKGEIVGMEGLIGAGRSEVCSRPPGRSPWSGASTASGPTVFPRK